MTMHTRVSGVWKEMTEGYENVGGVWKEITEGYENVGGVWKQFFQNISVSPAGTQPEHTRIRVGAQCWAGVSIDSDGTEYAIGADGTLTGTDLGPWLDDGDASNVWIRCTLNSGVLDGFDSGTGTWLQANTTRNWAILNDVADSEQTGEIVLDFATDSGGSNIIATATYNLSASYTTL